MTAGWTDYDARPFQMWMAADDVEMVIWTGTGGPLLRGPLGLIATRAQLDPEGELLRFSWQPATYPEGEEVPLQEPRQFARLLVQQMPAPAGLPERQTSKWDRALSLLREAQRVIGGEEFGGYVDVSSASEGLHALIDDLKWKVYEQAGSPGTFNEFWGEKP